MPSNRLLEPVRGLVASTSRLRYAGQTFMARSMATLETQNTPAQSPPPVASVAPESTSSPIVAATTTTTASTRVQPPPNPFLTNAICTLYKFPSLEPSGYQSFDGSSLLLPLRRDILHRAVVFEGDGTRQGTASTKWRDEVHGSNRKIRPQKGLGKARLGDRKSPMLKGGGVAFGPKPRDFSTDLPRKIYDLAWRTALSYRYRRGQLIVVDRLDIQRGGPGSARWLTELLQWHSWGSKDGRTLFVTQAQRRSLKLALDEPGMGKHARVLEASEVDVKDLLEMGRVVIEQDALKELLRNHASDLHSKVKLVV